MSENINSNTGSKDSSVFWIFFGLWAIAIIYLLSIREGAASAPDSVFIGYRGLRNLAEVGKAVRFFLVLKAIGTVGTAIALSAYAYRISGQKIAYMFTGILSLLSPILGVITYFIVRATKA